MPNDTDIDLDTPGLAFSKLLRLAKPGRVKSLLPDEILDIMDGLEPGFSTSGKLVLSRLRSGLSTHLGSLSFEGQGAFSTQR